MALKPKHLKKKMINKLMREDHMKTALNKHKQPKVCRWNLFFAFSLMVFKGISKARLGKVLLKAMWPSP